VNALKSVRIFFMKRIRFGKTDEAVSWLGMGGMRFEKGIPEQECINNIKYANELGINYFDTAPVYNEDRSEGIYGRAFKQMPRDGFKVATKGDNKMSAREIEKNIDRSLLRLNIDQIDFYFLWCLITMDQFHNSIKQGRSLEAILAAREQGKIKHVGTSIHMYSDNIKIIVDEGIFDFIMVPFNALNFKQRMDGLKYAHEKGLGTAVMNPLYGGLIPEFQSSLKIYPESTRSAFEDALLFCLESPYIDVSLAGMNSRDMITTNTEVLNKAVKCLPEEQERRELSIEKGKPDMCTSCGYCLSHCPEKINIRSYMEIYNTYMLGGSIEKTEERSKWYHSFGPLFGPGSRPADCTECRACEEECTQYLDIIRRLEWLDQHVMK